VAGAQIYQGHCGAPKRVGAVDARVEADARDPLRDEPCVLPWRRAPADYATAREQKFTRLLACGPEIVVDRLPCLVCQLELDWAACLPLADCRAVNRVAVGGNVLDLKGPHAAATKLAVDRHVDQGKGSDAGLAHHSRSARRT